MTAEELAEVMKAVDANRPHITQTMNFNAPIGQQISHVDKIEAHFDKDMGMQITNVGDVAGVANNKSEDEKETGKDHELCITLNSKQQAILKDAEKEGIIKYNPTQQGYVVGDQSSKVLVAYLCGKLFCGDYTNKNGQWKAGGIFNEAKHCKNLFDFDVAGTRRSAQGNGAGKSPIGHERVDKIFE